MSQFYMTFNEWFTGFLAWFLKQRPETTSEETPYQRIDAAICMTVINIAISELVIEAKKRYATVMEFTFDEDTNRLYLPYEVAKVLGVYSSSTAKYEKIASETELGYSIRKESDNVLYNDDGWKKGDKIKLNVVKRPPRITTVNDVLQFPDEHVMLLWYKVLDLVKVQSGEASTIAQDRTYLMLLNKWRSDSGRIDAEFKTAQRAYAPIGG